MVSRTWEESLRVAYVASGALAGREGAMQSSRILMAIGVGIGAVELYAQHSDAQTASEAVSVPTGSYPDLYICKSGGTRPACGLDDTGQEPPWGSI